MIPILHEAQMNAMFFKGCLSYGKLVCAINCRCTEVYAICFVCVYLTEFKGNDELL
jgi:hypothetical protein